MLIIAGCGIHNDGHGKSQHDGIHYFHICKDARVKYIEKHYGEVSGDGERVLNPTTVVSMEETIRQLRKKKPECKVMVGGAVLNQDYSDMIGADFYGKDAMQSVYYAQQLFGGEK